MKQENKIISKEVSNASLYLAAALQEMMDSTIVNYSNGMEDVPGNIIQLSKKSKHSQFTRIPSQNP